MCGAFCTKMHLKNVDTWKITIDILILDPVLQPTKLFVVITMNNKTSVSY